MFDLYFVDGWDSTAEEPVGSALLLLGNVPTARECVRQMAARVPVAQLDHGPGQAVVLDPELGRVVGGNVRVDPYLLAAAEGRRAAEDAEDAEQVQAESMAPLPARTPPAA